METNSIHDPKSWSEVVSLSDLIGEDLTRSGGDITVVHSITLKNGIIIE